MTGIDENVLHRELALQSWTFAEQVFDDRFRSQEVLKRGQRVVTLRGVDLSTDQPVVIKLVDSAAVPPGAHMRLEHEARVMRETNEPSCCGFTHSGRQDGLLYLVRPYCEGVTLQQRLAERPLDAGEAVALGRFLMTALHEAHSRGILHLDIRPLNVIVDSQSPLTQATLIDFGSRSTQLASLIDHEQVAAACYMSPEQAGLLDQDVDETTDLYAAGVVLFECLAGQPLFDPTSVGEVLRQHMTSPPPELRTLSLAVPRSLDEVIQRLLRRDPRDRYQSAEAAGADLALIAESLERGESEPSVVIGLCDRRRTLTEPAFVGRSQELATLQAQLERSRRGQNRLVFLEAESGGGKSRLLQEFMLRCVQQGTWVLRGQGLDQAAQRPFQMLAGIAAGLITDSRLKPAFADKVYNALGDQLDAVCASLPELTDVFRSTPADIGPETFAETRSLHALSVLLDALGAAGRPVVLLLDDCQWADQLTLKVLRHWQRRREAREVAGRGGALVVAAFRSEEVPEGHELRSLRPSAYLTLPEFQTSDVRQLAESMAGPLPDEAVDLIERLAAGNPFMASAALRGLVESGALVAADDGWQVEPLAMSDVQSSRHAAAFLARRIDLLPESSIRLLSVGAVLGKDFDLFTAATLARQDSDEAIAALDEARHRHIVWARVQDSHCAFMHDKLRETLLDRLPEKERRELHQRAALNLETQEPQPVFELAYHFDSAGESQRALPYALAAAEQARTQHSLEVAEQQYRIAGRGAPAGDQALRCQIAEGLGDVLMLRGQYSEAAEQFETARELATGANAQASIEGKIGELAFKRGNNEAAAEALERSLRSLGRRVPTRTAGFLLFLAWEVFVQTLHTIAPKLFLARRRMESTDEEFLAIRLYTRLTYAYFFDRGKVPCLWAHLRAMNLAERYPPTPELGHAWATHAPVMALLPWLRRGEAFAKKSFEVRKQLGDLWGQGQSLNYWGVLLSVGSRFDNCISKLTEAVRLLQRTGDVWEVHIAQYLIADAIYRQGDLPTALAQAKRLYKSAHEMGDDKVSGFALDAWSRASGGQLPADIVQREMQKERHDVQATVQVLLAEGVRRIGHDDFAGATEILTRAQKVCGDVGMKNDWVAPVWPWKATALRLQWQNSTDLDPKRRRQLLADTRKAARQAISLAKKFRSDLPHALREAGLGDLLLGRIRRARKYLDESLDVAEELGLRFENAQTRLARGRAGLALGWPGAADDVAAARQTLIELGVDFALVEPAAPRAVSGMEPVTLSLADRFDTVLESGRQIASALTRDAIFAAVRDAALKLLRGEQCLVLPVNPDSPDERAPMTGETTDEFCPTLVRRALENSRAVTYTAEVGTSGDVSEALLLSGVRSALCTPILVRGRPEACFYVTHRGISGLFGEDEQRLAEFIATIAGAALENAEGFAQLQQLTETLEERVQRRTAALEASNIELRQFAYVASHDLQTPLRGIAGFAHLLQQDYQGKLDDKANDYLDEIVASAKRLQVLINDLLSYSRVESRSRPFEPIALNEVFDDAVAILRSSIEESAGQVTRDELPIVPGDRSQLSQLLQNLIGNGLTYHGDQPPSVHVSADNSVGAWTVSVSDNGIGMDAKHHERVFEIFHRLHSQDQYPGTGIGLAVCRRIVHRHGGKIWVESEPGKGSTFRFTILAQ